MEKSSDKLVVCRFRDGVLSTWFQSGRAAELEFSRAHETEVGAIYLARVSHVQKKHKCSLPGYRQRGECLLES